MNVRIQLYIDKLIRPIVSFLNIFVRLLGLVLKIDHSLENKQFKTIAVCKFKGLGSIVQATPMLKTLRVNFPSAKIIFVTIKANKAILKKIDLVDEVITIDDSGIIKLITGFPGFIYKLISNRISVYIDLEIYSNFSSFVTLLSLSKNRIGYYLRSSNYRLGNFTHMMFFNIRAPIFQTYLQMARLLKCTNIFTGLYCFDTDVKRIQFKGATIDLENSKYIVFNPNASDLRVERRWHKDNFIKTISLFVTKHPEYFIYLIGSTSEREYVDQITTAVNHPNVYSLAGKTTLDELIAVITHASLMISNDTGPYHLAVAQNAPVVGLFGPCSPYQYGSYGKSQALYRNIYCSPCVHEFFIPPCNGNNVCMQLISPDEVLASAEVLLKSMPPDAETQKDAIIYTSSLHPLGLIERRRL